VLNRYISNGELSVVEDNPVSVMFAVQNQKSNKFGAALNHLVGEAPPPEVVKVVRGRRKKVKEK
jgi:hypothetical protein